MFISIISSFVVRRTKEPLGGHCIPPLWRSSLQITQKFSAFLNFILEHLSDHPWIVLLYFLQFWHSWCPEATHSTEHSQVCCCCMAVHFFMIQSIWTIWFTEFLLDNGNLKNSIFEADSTAASLATATWSKTSFNNSERKTVEAVLQ